MDITLRHITAADKAEWFRMRKGIWPDVPDEYMTFDMDDLLSDEEYVVIFACDGERPVGMIEAGIREYGEGCETSPVGYLEAWFVQNEYRGKRIASMLTQAAEDWARGKGCSEMASDTWLENEPGIRAHLNVGFSEVERLVHFKKKL
jgi:aminoglycoside 6'-N-acetyltransferase I